MIKNFGSSSLNLFKILAVIKHYKKMFVTEQSVRKALRKKCPYSELFWSAFRIQTEYSVSLRTQSECGKWWNRITTNKDIFLSNSLKRLAVSERKRLSRHRLLVLYLLLSFSSEGLTDFFLCLINYCCGHV